MFFYLAAAFVALNILDVATTVAILRHGGREMNSIIRKVMDVIGVVPALIVVKAVLVPPVLYVTYIVSSPHREYIAGVLVAGYLVVVVHNAIQWHKSRSSK